MKKTFFSHDKNFYAALFPLLIIISLQNLISYSVNMADNIMLGAYSQNALSGAALVNQIFFLIQQASVVIGDGLVVISSQYWGQNGLEDRTRLGNLFDYFMLAVSRSNVRLFYVRCGNFI